MSIKALPAAASVAFTFAFGLLTVLLLDFGPVARHMVAHIAVMNLVAPLAALLVARRAGSARPRLFWAACMLQISLLWFWHAPLVHAHLESPAVQAVMHVSLFLAALAFWVLLLNMVERAGWQAVLGLLLTGKLACLLGALLIFAPRLLYDGDPAALSDQQLAGLLMITACPLSYVAAGIAVAARLVIHRPVAAPFR